MLISTRPTRTLTIRSTARALATAWHSSVKARATSPTRRARSTMRKRPSLRDDRHPLHRTTDRHRWHQRHHLAGQHDVTCLSFRATSTRCSVRSRVGFENWSDATPWRTRSAGDFGEVHTPFEAAALEITAPGEESGTYDTYIGFAITTPGRAGASPRTSRELARLHTPRRRQRDHREHCWLGQLAGMGWLRLRRRKLGHRHVARGRRRRRLRRTRTPTLLRRASTRCAGRCSST